MNYSDEDWMKEALKEARMAASKDEVPVGVVVVCANQAIARAHNLTETLHDVTAHAEMQAITSAAHALGGRYIDECTLYVTLEPCVMCAGALFGRKWGGWFTEPPTPNGDIFGGGQLHPKTEITGGVLANESSQLLKTFFQNKRNP